MRPCILKMSSRTLTLNIPHRLTQEEARGRIQGAVGQFRSQFSGNVAALEERWQENHMDFSLQVLGQRVTGQVDVEPHQVRLEVDLPWLLAALADSIRPRLEQEGRRLLSHDPDPKSRHTE
jgi:hypothetical protein